MSALTPCDNHTMRLLIDSKTKLRASRTNGVVTRLSTVLGTILDSCVCSCCGEVSAVVPGGFRYRQGQDAAHSSYSSGTCSQLLCVLLRNPECPRQSLPIGQTGELLFFLQPRLRVDKRHTAKPWIPQRAVSHLLMKSDWDWLLIIPFSFMRLLLVLIGLVS